ncbi:hypothetical protein G7048_22690 [Diaphorobacter sp. HDW4B]|uniref:DUF6475 domain-containing protein n=1 Tax=Diaphorobacter sp. HDW4B TaxID=2714925 RepID=UPI00140D0050|nr:DUF6475 domain-containing protein [Diaphorobacter sp. HDW4B]QIL72909.1 hypothetical protein G7048_22690 [Diaphorobacter sp. HDW4B]
MQQQEFQPFRNLVTDVMAYYGKDTSNFVLDIWWNACRSFELEQIVTAMQKHCADPERGQFAPKVADIARALTGTTTERAALAWGKVHEAMSAVGAYTDVVFDDPAIHAVLEDLGGWPKVCRTEIEELSYLQHRFCEGHKAYTARGNFEFPRRLMGDRSPDHEYTSRGIQAPRPALIGNVAKAKQVYLAGNVAGKTVITYQALQAIESAPRALLPAEQEARAA